MLKLLKVRKIFCLTLLIALVLTSLSAVIQPVKAVGQKPVVSLELPLYGWTIANFVIGDMPPGNVYSEALALSGLIATDQEDGDLTSQIMMSGFEQLDVTQVGSYLIEYRVTDSDGLTSDAFVREFNLRQEGSDYPGRCFEGGDKTDVYTRVCGDPSPWNDPPVITLLGANPINLTVGDSFTDPGATASDPEDGDITADIIKTGSVNTAIAASYTLYYNVQDSDGLAASQKMRVVVVNPQGTPPPPPPPGPPVCAGGCGPFFPVPRTLEISNERVVWDISKKTAVVSWDTNMTADSRVVFGQESQATTTTDVNLGYGQSSEHYLDLFLGHSVSLPLTDPHGYYYFRAISNKDGYNRVIGRELVLEFAELPVEPTPPTPTPPVEPLQCPYLLEFIKIDRENNPVEVRKLQNFLISFEDEQALEINGFYGQATFEAVKRFQDKYFDEVLAPWGETEPTGYVYLTTKKKVNEIYCDKAYPLNSQEQDEVDNFRQMLEQAVSSGTPPPDGPIGQLNNQPTVVAVVEPEETPAEEPIEELEEELADQDQIDGSLLAVEPEKVVASSVKLDLDSAGSLAGALNSQNLKKLSTAGLIGNLEFNSQTVLFFILFFLLMTALALFLIYRRRKRLIGEEMIMNSPSRNEVVFNPKSA